MRSRDAARTPIADELFESLTAHPAGFHSDHWVARLPPLRPRASRRRAAPRAFSATFGPDAARLARDRVQRRRRAARKPRSPTAGRRPSLHRAARPSSSSRRTSPRIPRLRRAPRALARVARPSDASWRCSIRRASRSPDTATTAPRSTPPRPTDQRAVGDRRLGAGHPRRARRLPPLGRRAAAGRRAAGQPDPRRAQPRRDGRPARSGARDPVLCLSREAGAFDLLHDHCLEVNPFDTAQTATALDDRAHPWTPDGASPPRAIGLRDAALAHPASTWLDDARRPGAVAASTRHIARAPRGTRRTPRARRRTHVGSLDQLGRLLTRPHRDADTASRSSRSRASRSERVEPARSPWSSPANIARVAIPIASRATPLALVDGRPAVAAPPPSCVGYRSGPGAAATRSAHVRGASPRRSCVVRQCSVTAIGPLRSTKTPGSSASAASATAATAARNGSTAGIGHHDPSPTDPSARARTDRRVRDRRRASCVRRNSTGRPLTMPTRPNRCVERSQDAGTASATRPRRRQDDQRWPRACRRSP